MLLISSRGVYGVAAMFAMGLSYGKKANRIKDIAGSQSIPEDYLRQLLLALKKGGLVKSVRGAGGGYALAKLPAQIMVKEIVEILDGPINLVSVVSKEPTLSCYWEKNRLFVSKIFETTLEDILLEKQRIDGQIAYQI